MLPCGVYNERYAQDMAIVRTKRHWAILLISLFFLYLFPVFDLQYFISLINYLCITFIIVLGLQIVTGFCGQVSFGQAGFMAIGAYTSAILTLKFGVSFWLALPLSGLSAAVAFWYNRRSNRRGPVRSGRKAPGERRERPARPMRGRRERCITT